MTELSTAGDYSALPSGSLALVTGATGFTGSVLVKQLAASGVRVRAVARPSSDISSFANLDIEWIRAQVFDAQAMQSAMQGVEYVFHVAAAYREAKISDATYSRVHVDSTKILAEAALQQPNFKRFVHVSTVGVHGHIDSPPADESYPFSPGDVYQRTKLEAELWIKDFASRTGLSIVVVRPAAIYGPGDKRLLKIFKMANRSFFPLFGRGKGLYHLVHVEDLSSIFVRVAVHPAAQGEVFIAGNSEPTELKEIVRVIASAIGNTKLRFVRLPVWPLFIIADLCEFICKPLGIEPPIYRRRVAFFTKDRAFNTQKLRNVLGFRQKFTVEEGLTTTANWYQKAGWL